MGIEPIDSSSVSKLQCAGGGGGGGEIRFLPSEF